MDRRGGSLPKIIEGACICQEGRLNCAIMTAADPFFRGKHISEYSDTELTAYQRNSTIPLWAREFLFWYTTERRSVAEQNAKLTELSGMEFDDEARKDFIRSAPVQEYKLIIEARDRRALSERMNNLGFKAADHLEKGMAKAAATDDLGNLFKATGQVLQYALPRADDVQAQQITVNVQLTPKQQALEELPPIDVIAEPC